MLSLLQKKKHFVESVSKLQLDWISKDFKLLIDKNLSVFKNDMAFHGIWQKLR